MADRSANQTPTSDTDATMPPSQKRGRIEEPEPVSDEEQETECVDARLNRYALDAVLRKQLGMFERPQENWEANALLELKSAADAFAAVLDKMGPRVVGLVGSRANWAAQAAEAKRWWEAGRLSIQTGLMQCRRAVYNTRAF